MKKKFHNQDNCWFDGKQFIPFENMSRTHLKAAKIHTQKRELYYFNRHNLFDQLFDYIMSILEKPFDIKSIEEHYNTLPHSKKEKLKFERFPNLDSIRAFALKKRKMYWREWGWHEKQAKNIDDFCTSNGIPVRDYPSQYHRNSRKLREITNRL